MTLAIQGHYSILPDLFILSLFVSLFILSALIYDYSGNKQFNCLMFPGCNGTKAQWHKGITRPLLILLKQAYDNSRIVYGVPLVLNKAGAGGVVHEVICAGPGNLVLAVEGVFKMEGSVCQFVGDGTAL